jgi:SM-20-related protein
MSTVIQGQFQHGGDDLLFAKIADDLEAQGYCVVPIGLPEKMISLLAEQVRKDADHFDDAGVGRGTDSIQNSFVRRDKIAWIEGKTEAEKLWLNWTNDLRLYLNRRLLLGLFSFESHFACYEPGAFYRKHLDAFRGQANRILSTVLYLNSGWLPEEGGELQMYNFDNEPLLKVTPQCGSLVVFLSEEFPHEVLPASRHRYSVAGWYRLNQSINGVIDPPT